ncbi:MAG: hypothetical protein BJ554DRAFT_812 [Olpidium bornovanus]|uniref:Uncharacterized protein n=1 Tax=Olpidium bornovanus TaxID=278681 RepID=A0A8H7ZTH3_9FUNG|nr:MAG: hypothetical protein BJ554DRAFT_812 [Olpidium bornovanus]
MLAEVLRNPSTYHDAMKRSEAVHWQEAMKKEIDTLQSFPAWELVQWPYPKCRVTRASTTGVVIQYAGGPVSWRSAKQQCVATSPCEAEFIAGSAAAQEVRWLCANYQRDRTADCRQAGRIKD